MCCINTARVAVFNTSPAFIFNIKISIEGLEIFRVGLHAGHDALRCLGPQSTRMAPAQQAVLSRRPKILLGRCGAKSRQCQMEDEGDSVPPSICFQSS